MSSLLFFGVFLICDLPRDYGTKMFHNVLICLPASLNVRILSEIGCNRGKKRGDNPRCQHWHKFSDVGQGQAVTLLRQADGTQGVRQRRAGEEGQNGNMGNITSFGAMFSFGKKLCHLFIVSDQLFSTPEFVVLVLQRFAAVQLFWKHIIFRWTTS